MKAWLGLTTLALAAALSGCDTVTPGGVEQVLMALDTDDRAVGAVRLEDGSLIMAFNENCVPWSGRQVVDLVQCQLALYRIDGGGDLEWKRYVGEGEFDYFGEMRFLKSRVPLAPDGVLYVGGFLIDGDDADMFVARVGADGTVAVPWQHDLVGGDDVANGVFIDDDRVIACGYSHGDDDEDALRTASAKAWDLDGGNQWAAQALDVPDVSECHGVARNIQGLVLAAGYRTQGAEDDNFWVGRIETGIGGISEILSVDSGHGLPDRAQGVVALPDDGEFLVSGYAYTGSGGDRLWNLRLNKDGVPFINDPRAGITAIEGRIRDLARDFTGGAIGVGSVRSLANLQVPAIFRISAAGVVDQDWAPAQDYSVEGYEGIPGEATGVWFSSDGGLLVSGSMDDKTPGRSGVSGKDGFVSVIEAL